MRVVNILEMKEIERQALEQFGLDESLIIENIGIKGANKLHELFLSKENYGEIVFLIGKGNNGARRFSSWAPSKGVWPSSEGLYAF